MAAVPCYPVALKETSVPDEDAAIAQNPFIRIVPILLLLVLIAGAGLRLSGLTDHTIGHNEIYVPGVRLPADLSIPGPRLTLRATLISTILTECHPPGYYVFMLPWTMCFGYNPLAIRLPSVMVDTATILLIYLLGAQLGLRKAGVLGSFLWATAGLPIHLAQEARMYPLATFLGVLATVLLVESYGGDRSRQRRVMVAYTMTILTGLAVSHFFWPILITHILYVQLGPSPPDRRGAPQAQWQLFALALASPLLAVAVFQSGRSSYLSPNVWSSVQAYFRLLYVWYSAEAPKVNPWLSGAASLGCVLLLVVGMLRTRGRTRAVNHGTIGCPEWLLYAAAALAFVSIEAFAWIAHHRHDLWLARRTGAMVACGAIPLLALAADSMARRGHVARGLVPRLGAPLGPIGLVAFLAVIPVGLLALVSTAIPLLVGRTISLFAPYLMLMISIGGLHLGRARWTRGVAVLLLLALNLAGFLEYRGQPHSPTDYSALARQVAPKTQPGDLWFIFKHWATTPIFYYLDADRHTFVARDHAQVLLQHPQARVWTLGFEGLSPPARVTAPLSGHHRQDHVEARGIYADLYVPGADDATERPDAGDHDAGLR